MNHLQAFWRAYKISKEENGCVFTWGQGVEMQGMASQHECEKRREHMEETYGFKCKPCKETIYWNDNYDPVVMWESACWWS